jgi:hypothetical protein
VWALKTPFQPLAVKLAIKTPWRALDAAWQSAKTMLTAFPRLRMIATYVTKGFPAKLTNIAIS